MDANIMPGKFITFEGIDGAGKSTHIEFLVDFLRAHGKHIIITREPGGTPLGEKLRALLLHEKMDAETEAMLMFAARREHLAQVIYPALANGTWVISDRFTDATFAYQGGGRKVDIGKLGMLECWTHDAQPDLTFLFDLPPEVARERLSGKTLDKFEMEGVQFYADVRAEYLRRAEQFPERFRVIDATQDIPSIRKIIAEFLMG